MKRFLAAILASAALLGTTACTGNGEEANATSATSGNSQIEAPLESGAYSFESYESILELYEDIVFNYPFHSSKKWDEGYIAEKFPMRSESDKELFNDFYLSGYYIYDAYIYGALSRNDQRLKYGYALYDINGNSTDELILLTDNCDIFAIFTLKDGAPELLISLSEKNDTIWIDYDNNICLRTAQSKEDYSQLTTVYSIDENDSKSVKKTIESRSGAYYLSVDGETKSIPSDEGGRLMAYESYHRMNDPHRYITRNATHLDFKRLGGDIHPKTDLYRYDLYRESYISSQDGSFELKFNKIDENTVYFDLKYRHGFGDLTLLASVTAKRDGFSEEIHFDTGELKGYLELCAYGSVWLCIDESKIEDVEARIYKFDTNNNAKG